MILHKFLAAGSIGPYSRLRWPTPVNGGPGEWVTAAEGELADTGGVVLRASGTEPVIRVMVEGQDRDQVASLAQRLAAVVAESAA